MKIIIDDKIPFIRGALEPFAEVVYLPGWQTTASTAKDADALITRTRTACNKKLLQDSKVKFIATATSGSDHIDTDFCKAAGIGWTSAPGCNAESVNQYVASALSSYSIRKNFMLEGKTIGIIGVGQVGSRIAKTCGILGMNVLLCDPPRARSEDPSQFVSLESIQQQADIISFHVPLSMAGEDKTFHMANKAFLGNLKNRPVLVNSSRGEVFDSRAMRNAIHKNFISGAVMDCWENEPDVDLELLNLVDFGTPHIAGYSVDGKANGTKMSVRAISQFFNLGIDGWEPAGLDGPVNPVVTLEGGETALTDAILATYDITRDDQALRHTPDLFEQLRSNYPCRREFACWSIITNNLDTKIVVKLQKMGFKTVRK